MIPPNVCHVIYPPCNTDFLVWLKRQREGGEDGRCKKMNRRGTNMFSAWEQQNQRITANSFSHFFYFYVYFSPSKYSSPLLAFPLLSSPLLFPPHLSSFLSSPTGFSIGGLSTFAGFLMNSPKKEQSRFPDRLSCIHWCQIFHLNVN